MAHDTHSETDVVIIGGGGCIVGTPLQEVFSGRVAGAWGRSRGGIRPRICWQTESAIEVIFKLAAIAAWKVVSQAV
jgi:hypothetical protein